MAQSVKNPSSVQETWVWSLGWEDPLEEGMATHSSILAWRIPMDRGAWWATVHGIAGSDMTEWLSTHSTQVLLHHLNASRWYACTTHHTQFPSPQAGRRSPSAGKSHSFCRVQIPPRATLLLQGCVCVCVCVCVQRTHTLDKSSFTHIWVLLQGHLAAQREWLYWGKSAFFSKYSECKK